jgi:hypothetical protein
VTTVPICPACKKPLTNGGDEFDPTVAQYTFGSCCGAGVIGECLDCEKVYHPSGNVWIPHPGVSYRALPSDKQGETPFPRLCATCAIGHHDACLKAWVLKSAALPTPLRYICTCSDGSHEHDQEIDWAAIIVRDENTPDQ